ncbi:LysM peptidoglycan-binding domain-containing protein [Alicyclobacillus sp. ALC3]|uniref:LysM peptidoglycan-binding domain-containing protein n=1 Tax=Alicyclobacillus sp. ALC3 TaxID=2796143 RepID=UPI0023785AB1|nr:LysM domain-containing protein [Alicyclobacillus sp. ALC3]WDL97294.1 LysM peptidoglycan-binding domain-containing protein [Alicyclobacillus sp. ALC3]
MVSLSEMGRMKSAQSAAYETHRVTRKTRTRLWGLFALCWIVGASFAFHFWVGVASAASTGVPYTVAPGDTVWSIASQMSGAGDPRQLVSEIIAQNHLNAAGRLYVGEVLQLPQNP